MRLLDGGEAGRIAVALGSVNAARWP